MAASLNHERHNAAMRPVLRLIVGLIGTNPTDLLVFAATVVTGLFLLIVKLGGDEPVLAVFMEDVAARLAHARLDPIDPQGRA